MGKLLTPTNRGNSVNTYLSNQPNRGQLSLCRYAQSLIYFSTARGYLAVSL